MQNKEISHGVLIPRRTTAIAIRSQDDDEPIFIRAMHGSLSGLLSFIAAGLMLISCAAAVAFTRADPDALITPLALVALLLSAFAGGFTTVRRTGSAPMLCGILCGGVITVFSMIVALLLRGVTGSGYELWQAVILHGATVLFSILGSFAGNAKKKVDPRKHKRFK